MKRKGKKNQKMKKTTHNDYKLEVAISEDDGWMSRQKRVGLDGTDGMEG